MGRPPGARQRPVSRWRRFMVALVATLALDLALCGLGSAVGGYELLALERQVRGANVQRIAAAGPELRDRAGVASIAFGLARLCWWPWRPLADAVAALPHLRAAGQVGPLLDAAADGSSAGAHALDGILPALSSLRQAHGNGGDAGARLLDGLQRGHGALQAALGDADRLQGDWAALDIAALPHSVQARLLPLGHNLLTLREALRVALAAPDLLGATRPRDYLLVPENPWDLRATGGFVGTTALLEARHGRVALTAYQPSTQVDDRRPGYVPPPLPLLVYEHFGNWFYRDANWSPDFPTSAQLLRYFYTLGSGRRPDGVIAFDSYLLGPLLQITGPVQVPGTRATLDAANAVSQLDYYVNHTGTLHKDFAGAAYRAVFKRLRALPAAQLATAARVLGSALQQKHLLLWLADGAVGSVLARHGWDGAINPTRADYLYVVDSNVHYNKINKLVQERIAYRATVGADRALRSNVTIAYTNTATLANIPKPQNNTLYEDFVRVYVPLGSRLLGVSGLTQRWPVTRTDNKTVFAGYLRVPSRAHLTVTFTYAVPPNALLDPATYHLTLQKQPGTDAIPISVELRAGAPGIRVGGGVVWEWQGALRTDVSLTAPLSGGQAHPVGLAYDASPRVPVAPGAQVEPWVVLPTSYLPTAVRK